MAIGTVTDADAVFYYFEMLKNIGAHSVLDAGMFLKRIGAVARQAMDCGVEPDVLLCGIDFFPEVELPVYEMVYDEIVDKDDFLNQAASFSCMDGRKFDAAVMLKADDVLSGEEIRKLTAYFMQAAAGIVTDAKIGDWMTGSGMVKGYYPVAVENSRFAWIPVDELRV